MDHLTRPFPLALFAGLFAVALIGTVASTVERTQAQASDIPLKEAKLNIEHNATDKDTGFQGAVDSEGWQHLDVARTQRPGPGIRGPGIARPARA